MNSITAIEDNLFETAIYIRVSTEEQAKEGFSINAQKEKLKQYAFARGWNICDFYVDDGISGKNLKDRPEAMRLIEDVKTGKVKNVLVYKIDRLTRSVKNLMELIDLFAETGCAFNSLMESIDTSSATGRMFIKIVGIFAEFERENLAERVSFGYEQKVREGNYINTSGVYGYDYIEGQGDLIVNQEEAEIVRQIFEMYMKGNSSTAICNLLIKNQVPTKRGGIWRDSTISSILSNPLYIGKVRYGLYNQKESFTVDTDKHEPILDEEVFNRVQAILQNRRKNNPRKYPGDDTYFLTFLVCDNCEKQLSTNQHVDPKVKTQRRYINYYCQNYKYGTCSCRGFAQGKIEKAFQEYFADMENFPKEESTLIKEEPSKEEDKRVRLEKKIAQNSKRMEDIRLLFTQDKLSFEEYKEFSRTLSIQAIQLQEELARLVPTPKEEEIDLEAIQDIITNLRVNWVNLTDAEKKQFLMMFVESIHVRNEEGTVTIADIKFNSGKAKNPDKPKTKKKRLTGIS